jgi:Asp-tRNA(Asn)/Glu-tRNA(Gln) amidotransferase A subunit family amidase
VNELYTLTATVLRQKLLSQEISTKDITTSLLARIHETEPDIKAWEFLDEDIIDAQLDKISDLDIHTHPLFGIPIGVKDIYNTFDMPTQMGSPIWKDFTPGNDARMVHYLRRNGAIILGKTVTAEFAVHYQDITRNPYDLQRSPGTSSSGSAAAVASGMVPIALGSQTAGSIGRPASYCGVYGFKPSFGVLPRIGVLKTTDSLDTLGFFARSVEDLALVFEASRVSGENYEYVHKYIDNYKSNPDRKYRVAVVRHPKYDIASQTAQKAFSQWTDQLKDAQIELVYTELPEFVNEIYDLHQLIYDKALAYYFKDEYAKHTLMSPIFYDIIQEGQKISTETYTNALQRQHELTQQFNQWMSSYDIILTLGAADEAPVGLTTPDLPDSNLIWTFLGLPSIMMPVLKGENNLPIGVLAISKKYQDLLLLDFMQQLKNTSFITDAIIT